MYEKVINKIRKILDSSELLLKIRDLQILADNLILDDDEYQKVRSWILEKQKECLAVVERIQLKDVLHGDWGFSENSSDIVHKSGGFFKVIGVNVITDQRENGRGWKQPMLDQGTESSIAGLISQDQDSGRKYLVEAKFEPGNYNKVLISPSLQVTYSNLERVHGGKRPRFAEFFDESDVRVTCLYSQWLPEDGGRFFLKRVKYMIVEIEQNRELVIDDNFMWVGVSTLKRLLHLDNLVNPHVRSLLAVL